MMDEHLLELTQRLRLAHTGFVYSANQLNPAQRKQTGVCGLWSPKDVVAHLIGWDASLKQFIVDIENFDPPYDVDGFNQRSVKSRADLPWDQVMSELTVNFAALMQAVATVEPQMKIVDRVTTWLLGRIEDYELHKGQFEAWLV